jgi:hypothetical protein
MIFLISQQSYKPNRVETPETSKDEKYHVDYGRWVIGAGSTSAHQDFLNRYELNRNFYMNKQWCVEEDLEAFFKDEKGNQRNRLKVTRNYIQPMVEQYRGNAERMTFDMKVTNLSPMAKSRRERSLARLMAYNNVAKQLPGFGSYMQENNFPTGDSAEVESKFNNLYSDMYVISINRLLRYSKNLNNFEALKPQLAIDIALSGIGVMEPFPYAGEWMFKRISPRDFGWDRSAQDPTLSDSEFFFKSSLEPVSTLFERHQNLSLDVRKSIEKFASNTTGASYSTEVKFDVRGKVPSYLAVWRDLTVDNFGYVTDEFGQRILHRIDYIEENEEKPKYTMKDLVPYDDLTDFQKRVLKGSNSTPLYVDLWRYCEFIPGEILPKSITDNSVKKARDIVLEYGIVPYQEPDLYRPTNMAPPFKVGMWSYLDGETLSPVDVVINPQRMINRFLSVMENQINNSGGAGVVYDRDLIGAQPEDEIKGSIMNGEAIGIYAKGRGVQNVFGRYDSTPKESVIAFSALIESFKAGIEQVTGVNEGVKGDSGSPDRLVGVMQLMIQRGSLIQEPFYKSISDIYRGCYQSIASSGKRFYIDHDVELSDAIGEDGCEIFKLSKDVRNESMRISLIRSMDTLNERVSTDATIMSWLQFQLIDRETASTLYGRASLEEALVELREYNKRLSNQQRMAAQQQQQMAAQQASAQETAGKVIYQEGVADKTRAQQNENADRMVKMQEIASK